MMKSTNIFYAGIGSRETPDDILHLMYLLGRKLAIDGYVLRSGHAAGADLAFEKGCDSVNGRKEIFLAKHATLDSIEYSSSFHDAWDKCTDYVKQLHGRNAMILLGTELIVPVGFVVCWTSRGLDVGGTGLGIRIAHSNRIKVINLYHHEWIVRIKKYLGIGDIY